MNTTVNSNFAPIVLFVFKRPIHTKKTLESLAANPEFTHSPLYIYCDGARNSKDFADVELTRNIANGWNHPNKFVIERDINYGLANSIIAGVSKLTKEYGQVIVVEDDLVVSTKFLNYLNSALRKYRNSARVMQISAHTFPAPEFADKMETIFLPFISSWGWATWQRAWESFDSDANGWNILLTDRSIRKQFNLDDCYDYSGMLVRQMTGEIDSWAIRWNWSVFQSNGLVIYPPTSFVQNIGFDGSGTHCSSDNFHDITVSINPNDLIFPDNIEISIAEFGVIKKVIKSMGGSFVKRVFKRIRTNFKLVKVRLALLRRS